MVRALVRRLASTFENSLKSAPRSIDMAKAGEEHQRYVEVLKQVLGAANVIQVPADDRHPDCCFIEDTAVVVGNTAVIARPGAIERQGEEQPVAEELQRLSYTLKHIQPTAVLEGGDVLQLPDCQHILVGLSKRTNAAAVWQLQQYLPGQQVHAVPVPYGLHLKSAVTALDGSTLLFSDNEAGTQLSKELAQLPALNSGQIWQHIMVPDPVCANVLLIGDNVVMQESDERTEQLFERLCAERNLQLHKLPRMEQFINADGALTCCSILL
eukprot:GHUV01057291.1.p1 GENE.GHUV01057291.1~~GHUV01057291.1.p1  ORF type:complete len:269 (+),score=58.59 GHUV01057291.1:739-1545(+)